MLLSRGRSLTYLIASSPPRPHFYGMLRADEMLVKARVCEEMANKATDLMSVHALREAARHWRTMAIQLNLLEQHQAYRIIRGRKDE